MLSRREFLSSVVAAPVVAARVYYEPHRGSPWLQAQLDALPVGGTFILPEGFNYTSKVNFSGLSTGIHCDPVTGRFVGLKFTKKRSRFDEMSQ